MAIQFLNAVDVTGEVQGTSLDINGNADISGTTAVGGTVLGTSAKFGRDAHNLIDFTTDNVIAFRVSNSDQVKLSDTALFPVSNSGSALGGGSNRWADLFLDSGAVINFNNGDVTITHASNQLTFAGGKTTINSLELGAADHVIEDGANILDENDNSMMSFASGVANITGNAATATTLATARNIGGVSFNGSAAITLPGVNAEGNQNTTGNAATATALTSGNKTITGDLTVNGDSITFNSANADDPRFIIKNTTNDDQASRLEFQKLRADDAVATGQNLGEIWFTGQDSAQNSEDYAYIVGEIDVSTGGQESGQLVFGVAAHDGSNRTGFKLTGGSVSAEVDVEIGLGSSSVTAVQGTLTAVGTITGSADVIAYSDKKLKENIKTLDGKKVLEMRGVSFDRVDTGKASSGVIAQEIQEVAPELVHDTDGTLGVAYGNLVGYLIEAIKDQQKQIDELKEMCSGCSK